jgi:mannan endo-1,4-beta-mannosidase
VVDIPGWGQETLTASQASPLLLDANIIFSAHVYPNGWNGAAQHSLCASDMDVLKSSDRPCLIGEFGTTGQGDVDVPTVVTHAKEIGFIGVLGWAWNGDGGDMNMVSPAWYEDATASIYHKSSYFDEVMGLL